MKSTNFAVQNAFEVMAYGQEGNDEVDIELRTALAFQVKINLSYCNLPSSTLKQKNNLLPAIASVKSISILRERLVRVELKITKKYKPLLS